MDKAELLFRKDLGKTENHKVELGNRIGEYTLRLISSINVLFEIIFIQLIH